MMEAEPKRLAEFATAIRESTLKRLRLVPGGFENWRINDEAMSFADVARHLVDADNWLFEKFVNEDLKPIHGRPGLAHVESRDEYLSLLRELEEIGQRRAAMLVQMTDEQFARSLHDERFGDEPVSAWWIIVRGNLDHEIHHRGQIAACLTMIAGRDPGARGA